MRVNSNGVFEFAEVPPSRYRFAAERNGYVRQTFGQRSGGPGVTFDVQPGQRVTGIEFRLDRAGVISGNVTDEDGEPVEGVPVYAQRLRFVAGGFQRVTNARTTDTDDLGNYRLAGLAPGLYYVRAAGRAEGSVSMRPATVFSYAPAYFPDVPTRDEAQKVQVRAGGEAPRIDLRVRTAATYTISGVIVDSALGTAGKRYNIGFATAGGWASRPVDRDDASFTLQGNEPGEYTVVASVNDGSGRSRRGYRKVAVTDSDVRVVIEIGRTAKLRGRARVEGDEAFSFERLRMVVEPEDDNAPVSGADLQEDGSFAAEEIPEGAYRFRLSGRSQEVYLKEIRCGGDNYSTATISLVADQVVDDCEAVLERDLANLNTFVSDGDKPAQGMLVVAIPQAPELRRSARHTVTAQTDVNGFAELRGLIPGDYLVFAVSPSDDSPYYDVEFPERNREAATTLTAKPKEQHSLSLKVTESR